MHRFTSIGHYFWLFIYNESSKHFFLLKPNNFTGNQVPFFVCNVGFLLPGSPFRLVEAKILFLLHNFEIPEANF